MDADTPEPTEASSPTSYRPPSENTARAYAWKYKGYKDFAEWIDKDHDFFLLRRFGALNARVLLRMQNRIVELERTLNDIDENVKMSSFDSGYSNHSLKLDEGTDLGRQRLFTLDQLEVELKKYNDYIASYIPLKSRGVASDRPVKNVKAWFKNNPDAISIDDGEQEFTDKRDDLVELMPWPRSYLRELIEKSERFRTSFLFKTRDKSAPSRDPGETSTQTTPTPPTEELTVLSSDAVLDRFATGTILAGGVALLLIPMWLMAVFSNDFSRLGIITAFTTLFTMVLLLTFDSPAARPLESLAAIAAYTAVLAVYLNNSGGQRI